MPKTLSLGSVEQSDPQLAGALTSLALGPSPQRHRLVAERYLALGIRDTAFRHYLKALTLDDGDAASHDGIARIWRDWGAPDRALNSAHRATFFAPSSAVAWNTLGTVLQALGQMSDARRAYARAVQIDARLAPALSNLCYLDFLEGQLERAVQRCRDAVAADQTFEPARHNLALVYAAAGRVDLTKELLAETSDPAVSAYNLGIILMAQQDFAGALAAFQEALAARPWMQIAQRRAAEAQRMIDARKRTAGNSR